MLYVQDPKASRIHMVFSPVSPEIAGTITHTTQKHVYNIKNAMLPARSIPTSASCSPTLRAHSPSPHHRPQMALAPGA